MSTMPLKPFSFPIPETRFFSAGGLLYKFKIKGGSSYSGDDVTRGGCFDQDLKKIIRTVLGNLNNLQPFLSCHFIVFPYKHRWKGVSKMICHHSVGDLRPYPFTLVLYLEKNMQSGKQAEHAPNAEPASACLCTYEPEPPTKCRRSDSPLEDAILKEMLPELVAECRASGFGVHTDNPHAEGDVNEDPGHVDKREPILSNEAERVSGVDKFRGSPGDVPAGTTEDMQEEEGDEEEHNSVPGSPSSPGILTRVARKVFPFSLLFRDP